MTLSQLLYPVELSKCPVELLGMEVHRLTFADMTLLSSIMLDNQDKIRIRHRHVSRAGAVADVLVFRSIQIKKEIFSLPETVGTTEIES